jgi:tetrahydromethanopterin S-methyltransferase subunit F
VTSSNRYYGLAAGLIAILLIAWLLVLQLEEFGIW